MKNVWLLNNGSNDFSKDGLMLVAVVKNGHTSIMLTRYNQLTESNLKEITHFMIIEDPALLINAKEEK